MTQTHLDGFALFSSLSANKKVFEEQAELADKAAKAIILAGLKSRSLTLDQARRIFDSIGAEPFALALDLLSDNDLTKLLKKLSPTQTTSSLPTANDLRLRILALSSKQVEPTPEPVRPTNRKQKQETSPKKEASWPTSVSARPKSSKSQIEQAGHHTQAMPAEKRAA